MTTFRVMPRLHLPTGAVRFLRLGLFSDIVGVYGLRRECLHLKHYRTIFIQTLGDRSEQIVRRLYGDRTGAVRAPYDFHENRTGAVRSPYDFS